MTDERLIADDPRSTSWGQAIRIRPSLAGGWLGIGPLWAALAGALSSAMPLYGQNALRLLTCVILVEAVYEAIFAALDWPQPERKDASDESILDWFPWLPYSSPHSPSGRLARWWNRALALWQSNRWTGSDGALARLIVTLALAGMLTVYVGPPADWALVAIVALGAISFLLKGRAAAARRWVQAIASIFLPWTLVGVLFGTPSRETIACAALYTVARGALIDRGRLETSTWALALADVCQLGIVVTLIVLKQPIVATALAIGLSAQVLLQVHLRQVAAERRQARAQPLVLLGMMLAGWVLGL